MSPRRNHAALALSGLLAAALLGGCSDDFLSEEMHLGEEAKLRPVAVSFDTPEASPGETVVATLLCWDPNPSATTVRWRLALDFDSGLYGSDPTEASVVDLASIGTIAPPVEEGNGFVTHTVTFTVPENTLVGASSLDPLLEDDVLAEVAEALFPGGPPEDFGKADVDAFLAALEADDLAALDEESRRGILTVADLFACEVRLRISVRSDFGLDVTRGLTVRHSRRLGSPNVNTNPVLTRWEVAAVEHPDFDWDDLASFEGAVERWSFLTEAGAPGAPPEVRVPRRAGWTYYLVVEADAETYSSPFSPDRLFEEDATYRWYWFRPDDPDDPFALFRDDDGEETEMYTLDEAVRFVPPPGASGSRARVISVVRDQRIEWERYGAAPGLTAAIGEIVFE